MGNAPTHEPGRTALAGVRVIDLSQFEAGTAGQGDAHDIGETKTFPLLAIGTPPQTAVGKHSIHIHGDGPDALQATLG